RRTSSSNTISCSRSRRSRSRRKPSSCTRRTPRARRKASTTNGCARVSRRSASSRRDVTPKPKSERPLSKRFAEHAAGPLGLKSLAAGVLASTLAACGSSTPRQADVEAPREVARVVASAEPAAAEATAAPERKRDRRSERRAAEAASAEAAVVDPVPEAAAAGYERAIAAMRAQNWVEAELELEQLVLEYPEYPGPHVNLALVYLEDGRRDDARKEIELALG